MELLKKVLYGLVWLNRCGLVKWGVLHPRRLHRPKYTSQNNIWVASLTADLPQFPKVPWVHPVIHFSCLVTSTIIGPYLLPKWNSTAPVESSLILSRWVTNMPTGLPQSPGLCFPKTHHPIAQDLLPHHDSRDQPFLTP